MLEITCKECSKDYAKNTLYCLMCKNTFCKKCAFEKHKLNEFSFHKTIFLNKKFYKYKDFSVLYISKEFYQTEFK